MAEARLFTSIWDDKDFVALPRDAQRLYMFLLSQKDLTRCGLIALRPPRWAGKAAGLTAEAVLAAVTVLHDTRFAIADWDTGELLVRSLIRRDEVWRQPNIMKSARRAATQLESAALRQVLLEELYRIPADGSTSENVRNEYAQFVAQVETSLGIAPRNPSANPSANPSGNADGADNRALHPSARLFTSIWDDKDFVALPRDAQRLYMFLLSQKDLTRCGLIALRPPRWAGKAAGLTAEAVLAAVTVLHDTRFAIADWDTGELLVRSLIRRDEVWRQPNIMKSARRAATQLESAALRQVLLEELYRIPADGSTSENVRNEYAQFVAQVETSLGIAPRNPSANPSANPSGNADGADNRALHLAPGPAAADMPVENGETAGPDPSPKGSRNPSDDPLQGKGEGR